MKFLIITPLFNADKYLRETIESVIFQKGDFEIEYWLVDGLSSDNSVEIINDYIEKIKISELRIGCNKVSINLISEKDDGMYDALVKGLEKGSGDVVAYINSDDFYMAGAFQTVREIFEKHRDINWLTGIQTMYNSRSQIVRTYTPFLYRKELVKQGFYNGYLLPFIQQESTFWRSGLNKLFNYSELSKLKLAGDYYIWTKFSKKFDLRIVECVLSGYRRTSSQKSIKDLKKYFIEFKEIVNKKSILSWPKYVLDLFGSYLVPDRFKRYINRNIIYFDYKDDSDRKSVV